MNGGDAMHAKGMLNGWDVRQQTDRMLIPSYRSVSAVLFKFILDNSGIILESFLQTTYVVRYYLYEHR